MPAKLKEETERVVWRIRAEDLALLHALFPGGVNTIAREVIQAYCRHLKRQMEGDGLQGPGLRTEG